MDSFSLFFFFLFFLFRRAQLNIEWVRGGCSLGWSVLVLYWLTFVEYMVDLWMGFGVSLLVKSLCFSPFEAKGVH